MDNTEIDNEDIKTINSHKDYTVGFNSEMITFSTLDAELIGRFKNHIPKAKGILINFTLNENQSLLSVSDLMEQIENIASSDAEIIFGTKVDENTELDKCKFTVLLTGLERIC